MQYIKTIKSSCYRLLPAEFMQNLGYQISLHSNELFRRNIRNLCESMDIYISMAERRDTLELRLDIILNSYQNFSKFQHILLKMLMKVAHYTLGTLSYIF